MADGLIRKGILFLALVAICTWFAWKPADGVAQLPRLLASTGLYAGALIAVLSGLEWVLFHRVKQGNEKKDRYTRDLAILFGCILILLFISATLFRFVLEFRQRLNFKFFNNRLLLQLLFQAAVCFIPLSFDVAVRLTSKWKNEVLSIESAKQHALKLQLAAISNQVNPHFLFNSLNALANLVRSNASAAESYIIRLSNCYRYLLDTQKRFRVDWSEEQQFIEDYIGLLKVRFGGNIHIQIDNTSHSDFQVVPFSVFMWIENTIRTSAIGAENPVGIVVRVKEGLLEIETRGKPAEGSNGEGILSPEDLLMQYQLLTGTVPECTKDGMLTKVKLPVFNC